MWIYLSLLVTIVGLIMFLAAKVPSDLKRIGEIMFAAGLLAFLIAVAGSTSLGFPVSSFPHR